MPPWRETGCRPGGRAPDPRQQLVVGDEQGWGFSTCLRAGYGSRRSAAYSAYCEDAQRLAALSQYHSQVITTLRLFSKMLYGPTVDIVRVRPKWQDGNLLV